MKERIYTIPINEAFDQDTECPLCVCERELEIDALEYSLGPAMMEPDTRMETNQKGFCQAHFTGLYNLNKNRLSLALVIDTHMLEQIKAIEDIYKKNEAGIKRERENSALNSAINVVKRKKTSVKKTIEELTPMLESLENKCFICDRINVNMDRLIENTIYLYKKEPDFKFKFLSSKGFCLKHFKILIRTAQKELAHATQAEFITSIVHMELEALKRIQDDVHHFINMFDYQSKGSDWKNSRDAVPRSIEKLSGPCDLN